MRFLKSAVMVTAFVILLFSATVVKAAPGQSISGRIVFEGNDLLCNQQCTVTLLASGVRPLQTVTPDIAGNFSFGDVAPGLYMIRVDINGFESYTQPVDAAGGGTRVTIMVPIVRKQENSPKSGGDVVHVSELRNQYPKKAVSYFEKGSDLLKKKKYDDAIRALRDSIERAPNFYEAHNQLGIAYREVGRTSDAENEFWTAHNLNLTGVEPLLNLTTLYLDENEPDEAIKTGEQAVKANSRSVPALLGLGMALYKAAQLDRAEATLQRALEVAPKMGTVRLMLANVYLKLNRFDNSLEQLNSYIAENPKGNQIQAALQMRDRLLAAKEAERP